MNAAEHRKINCNDRQRSSVGVAGAGLASWRKVAAENSEATERADEASKALRGCYESAVEALGRAGRHKQALQASFGYLFCSSFQVPLLPWPTM